MKRLVLLILSIFTFHGNLFCAQTRILIGSPVRQKPEILKEFLDSLDKLERFNVTTDYIFIDDNVLNESSKLLDQFYEKHLQCAVVKNINANKDHYECNEVTHFWNQDLIWKVAAFKNYIIEQAKKFQYDYLFLIDSDTILHPKTLEHLFSLKKDIVSCINWARWVPNGQLEPNVWLYDVYTQYEVKIDEQLTAGQINKRKQEFYKKLKKSGTYEVGGLGGCSLISKKALDAGVSFERIKNITFWGEDRHFCIRAAVLGFKLYVDTHYPAFHIYRESELEKLSKFKENYIFDFDTK